MGKRGSVRCVEDDHSCFGIDDFLELGHVDCPIAGRGDFGGAVFGRLKRDIANYTASHFDVGDISV